MKKNLIRVLVYGLLLAAILTYIYWYRNIYFVNRDRVDQFPMGEASNQPAPPPSKPAQTNAAHPAIKMKTPQLSMSEFSDFVAKFGRTYKPAIEKWCQAFAGHVPFDCNTVTTDRMVERVGFNSTNCDYIFLVNGITFGLQDANGKIKVHYLNAPAQTRTLATLPGASQPPVTQTPVSRDEVLAMVEADSGAKFQPGDVRIVPSGLSGSMNGGALVSVGGDPENGASWDYDMVFAPDGKLAYFLHGAGQPKSPPRPPFWLTPGAAQAGVKP